MSQQQVLHPLTSLPLNSVEELFWRAEEDRRGACRVFLLLRLDGYVDADLITRSLQHLQRRHPRLRAAVFRDKKERLHYRFSELTPPIDCEITEYDGEESPWRDVARRLLLREFPATGPLAAVAVLRNASLCSSELLVALHHSIADGLSAIMLADDLLREYARLEAKSDAPSSPDLTFVTVKRARTSAPWKARLKLVQRAIRLQQLEKRSDQTTLPANDDVATHSQWVHWVLSREETLRLIRSCRTEKTSLSGVLVAAVYCALAAILPHDEVLLKCQIPFSVREALQTSSRSVTGEDLGCFVGIMSDLQKVSAQTDFWEAARIAHQSFETFQKGGGPALCYNLAAVATTQSFARASPKLLAATGKRATLLITSYGVLNLKNTYGSLRPKACTLLPNNVGTGPSLVMEALVLGQQLNIGFSADRLEPMFWENLEVAVRAQLAAATRVPSETRSTPELLAVV